MASFDIAGRRLVNQRISGPQPRGPLWLVNWLGAVQAQDYAAAKWALGLRSQSTTDREIEQAFTDGMILRTHVMRPTWHFVPGRDIRWMLALTAPRIHGANTLYYRQLELDGALLRRTRTVFAKALQGGKQLTRLELQAVLQAAGIKTDGLRLPYIIMHAELDALICSGARRGKQFTYALLDERAPDARTLDRDEALAELTKRYFVSHGPATLKDYRWWSGLSLTDAQAGVETVKKHLSHETVDEQTYWFAPSDPSPEDRAQRVFLLPNFDEYVVGYTDRSAIFNSSHVDKLDAHANPLFQHTIVVDGQIVGTWKRTLSKDSVWVKPVLFSPRTGSEERAVASASQRLATFLGLQLEME